MSALPQRAPIGTRIAREWRRSWWILLTVVPFGYTTWAAFLYVGIAYRRAAWLIASASYAAVFVASLVLLEAHHGEHSGIRAFAGFLALAVWIGGFAHAMAIRRHVSEPRWATGNPALDAATERLAERRAAQELALRDPALARELGVGRPDIAGAHPRGVVDINNVGADAIVYTAAVSREVADHIIAARDRVGCFSSVDDIGSVAGLHPWDVERLKLYCVCLPRW